MSETEQQWNNHKIKVYALGDKRLVRVTSVLHALGIRNKKSCWDLYSKLPRSKHRFSGQRGTECIVMTQEQILTGLLPATRRVVRPGFIYLFRCHYNKSVYKVGCTYNWEQRRKNYQGLNRIGEMLLLLKVKNTRLAEHKIIQWTRKFMKVIEGHEWMECEAPFQDVISRARDYKEQATFCDGTEIDSMEDFIRQL